MDSKNLWIAYSDSEDLNNKNHIGKEQKDLIAQNTDSDTQDTIEDKILFTEVRINGQESSRAWAKEQSITMICQKIQ